MQARLSFNSNPKDRPARLRAPKAPGKMMSRAGHDPVGTGDEAGQRYERPLLAEAYLHDNAIGPLAIAHAYLLEDPRIDEEGSHLRRIDRIRMQTIVRGQSSCTTAGRVRLKPSTLISWIV